MQIGKLTHTPPPWKFASNRINQTLIVDRDGNHVAVLDSAEREVKGMILRAVNNHEALLDIARMALEVAEAGSEFKQGVKGIHYGVADRIREVIKNAEGF